jgi:hypothetical protein
MFGFLREMFLTIGELALLLLFLWGAAGMFQFLRGLIVGPRTSKKDEGHD